MSSSIEYAECVACPFDVGFDLEDRSLMMVCGNPSQRCINLRNKLPDQIAAWNRLAKLAEDAKSGILDFDSLYEGDILRIDSGSPGYSLDQQFTRSLFFKVDEIVGGELHGTVIKDSYSDEQDFDRRLKALETDQEVVIEGAFERTGVEDSRWQGIEIPGELHVGRYVHYRREDGCSARGLYVQEINLISEGSNVAMPIFGTDPEVHRQAPPLESQE